MSAVLSRAPIVGTCLVVLAVACTPPPSPPEPEPDAAPAESSVEAVSLLGEELAAPQLPDQFRQDQLDLLEQATAALDATPDDPEALIWVGRRTAYLGRYRQAIGIYTDGLDSHPEYPALYRHRGHRFISTRQLDSAIADLTRAAELVRNQPDAIEADGLPNERGIPTSTLQSNIFYHLGLAQYLSADFESALDAYERCLKVSTTPDNVVATSHWLYMTLRRLGRDDEAAAVLQPISAELDIIENQDYHRLLLMYKGDIDPEVMASEIGSAPGTLGSATLGYGLGNWFLAEGERDRALAVFSNILAGDQWAAFGYIAAEAEMARLPEHEREILLWRGGRLARLLAEDGWLAAVGLFPLEEGEFSFGTAPSADFVFPSDRELRLFGTLSVTGSNEEQRVHFSSSPQVHILVDREPVETIELASDAQDDTTYLNMAPYRFFVIERSRRHFLRVLDLSRPARIDEPRIPHFPIDAGWRLEARFEPYDPPRTIPVPTILETTNQSVSPGALVFERDGAEHRLDAIDSGDDLFVIFGDETTGIETYGGGRYIYTDLADDQGRVTLDFNKAYNPPCVFTSYATCPLPPQQNRLSLRVEAGERMVEGFLDH